MILNVGVGGGKFDPVTLNADVVIDILNPKFKLSNFGRSDAHMLPFKDKAFTLAYCHTVLEHVENPHQVIKELLRVSEHVHIVQDRLWSIGSYAEYTHLWWQGPHHKFYPYPRTRFGIVLSKWLHLLRERYFQIWQRLHFTAWKLFFIHYFVTPHYEVSI
jgi:SAM-dependent methyltransferase